MLFSVNITERAGWVVLSVVGEVDLATVPSLRSRVASAAAAPGVHLVVDLRGVDHIDSLGLGLLIGALRRVRRSGGELRVVADGPVRELLALTSLDQVLSVWASTDDATAVEAVGETSDA